MKYKPLSIALTVTDVVILILFFTVPGWHWAKIIGIILSVVTLIPQFVRIQIVDDAEHTHE